MEDSKITENNQIVQYQHPWIVLMKKYFLKGFARGLNSELLTFVPLKSIAKDFVQNKDKIIFTILFLVCNLI